VLALGVAAAALAAGGPGGPVFGYGAYPREARAIGFCALYAGSVARYRSCLVEHALQLVIASGDPADELPRIDRYVHSLHGWLENNCHLLMHAVGRRYGRAEHVTLSSLLHVLPRSNDPGCSAGFAHGLLTYLGPQIERLGPKGAAADCERAPTRYQRYSCIHGLGHAYARLFLDAIMPALAACSRLGPANAPDCAQGVFHDYWIALSGLDSAKRPQDPVTDPRALCGGQPARFVLPCWYRAFLEHPPRRPVRTSRDVLAVCSGLRSLQRTGCVVGASLILSSDPFAQLAQCRRLRGADADACVRGVRVPAIAGYPLAGKLSLIRGCAGFARDAQRGCYTWLGKALNVVDNGTFAARGCPRLRYAATRRDCLAGARSYEGALVTFS